MPKAGTTSGAIVTAMPWFSVENGFCAGGKSSSCTIWPLGSRIEKSAANDPSPSLSKNMNVTGSTAGKVAVAMTILSVPKKPRRLIFPSPSLRMDCATKNQTCSSRGKIFFIRISRRLQSSAQYTNGKKPCSRSQYARRRWLRTAMRAILAFVGRSPGTISRAISSSLAPAVSASISRMYVLTCLRSCSVTLSALGQSGQKETVLMVRGAPSAEVTGNFIV